MLKYNPSMIRSLLCAFVFIVLAGCATTSTTESRAGVIGNIPSDSKFAKISVGMSQKQVFDLIGQPTDWKVYSTGKAFIPFYFGRDAARTEALYKGEGRITFTGVGRLGVAFKVYRIVYDPTESGYNR